MGDVDAMLQRFALLYGAPKTDDQAAYFAEYRRALSTYSDAILQQAADAVIRGRRARAWPTIGDCVKACDETLDASRGAKAVSLAKVWPEDHLERIDRDARAFVCGTRWHEAERRMVPASGEWGPAFREHPWAQEAERDGWALALRSAVIATVKRRMLADEPYDDVPALMPSQRWIEDRRAWAERARSAAAQRAELIAEHGSLDAALGARRGRTTFAPLRCDLPAFLEREESIRERVAAARVENQISEHERGGVDAE